MSEPTILLTTDEVSERLRTNVGTLKHWRHTGVGPPSIRVGRRVLYAEIDVETWIQQQRTA